MGKTLLKSKKIMELEEKLQHGNKKASQEFFKNVVKASKKRRDLYGKNISKMQKNYGVRR